MVQLSKQVNLGRRIAILVFVFRLVTSIFVVAAQRLVGRRPVPKWTIVQQAALRAMSGNGRSVLKLPAQQARKRMDGLKPPRPFKANSVKSSAIDVDGLPGEWFEPVGGAQLDGVLLYLHGGAYVFGSVDTYRDLLHRLTLEAKLRILAVDYRLAPEHRFPRAVDDCATAYRWLLAQGTAADKIVLGGDSSGGGLALATLIGVRDEGLEQPAGAVLMSPWVDLTLSGESMASNEPHSWGDRDYLDRWVGEYLEDDAERDDPRASPLRAASLEGLAPLQLQVGSRELLYSEVSQLADRIAESNGEVDLRVYPDVVHGFQMMADLFPQGAKALKDASEFIAACLPPKTE